MKYSHPLLMAVATSPDGQVKLLHLIWARRVDYELVSEAVAMREAASLSR